MPARFQMSRFVLALTAFLLVMGFAQTVQAITVVGQVESMYRDRVSVKVLEVVGDASGTAVIKTGSRVSFQLPRAPKKRNQKTVQFGNVIEADIEGAVATEYAAGEEPASSTAGLMIWVASRAERVKNPKKYLEEKNGEEPKKGRGKRGKRDKRDKQEEAPRIWTQEETVRGKIVASGLKIYIKESFTRPKDKGLDIVDVEWSEKLKPFLGKEVVVSGVTHRTSIASGTVEVKSVMKVYPK